jgi:MoaA/NifB/PqqE/SkfB family radical SAM enzyme
MPFKIDSIDYLHLEITNYCNASCPSCPRFFSNSPHVNPYLNLNSWTIEDFNNYVPTKIFENLTHINFCGNHGDPILCNDFLKIIQRIDELGFNRKLSVHTNGGARTEQYWKELGKVFSKHKNWELIFSIDGLEDTNHIYRRNVKWDTLIRNIKAFKSFDNVAVWEYLIFRHNEHQIEKAHELSKKLNFQKFFRKKALNLDDQGISATIPAINKIGKLDYHIYPPINQENRIDVIVSDKGKVIELDKEFDPKVKLKARGESNIEPSYTGAYKYDELDEIDILPKCKTSIGEKIYSKLYIDANGNVSPCCWTQLSMPLLNELERKSKSDNLSVFQLYEKYQSIGGMERLNLNNNTMKNIMNILEEIFESSWNKKYSEGKTIKCAAFCGKKSDVNYVFTHKGNEK